MTVPVTMLIAAVIAALPNPAVALKLQPDGSSTPAPPDYRIATEGAGGWAYPPVRSPVPPVPKDWELVTDVLKGKRNGR